MKKQRSQRSRWTSLRNCLGISCYFSDSEPCLGKTNPMFLEIKKEEIEEVYRLANEAVQSAIEKNKTVSTAESCTGGMIASLITSVSGSSKVFIGGAVTYSNQLKMDILNVSAESLNVHGAVSSQVALEMARGIKKLTSADYNIAVTGIAGPAGGTPEKPVGLVYIAFSGSNNPPIIKKFIFKGTREEIRLKTTAEALRLLLEIHL